MTEGMSLHVSPLSFKGKIHLNCDLIWEYPRDQVWGEISERVDSFVRPLSRGRLSSFFLAMPIRSESELDRLFRSVPLDRNSGEFFKRTFDRFMGSTTKGGKFPSIRKSMGLSFLSGMNSFLIAEEQQW